MSVREWSRARVAFAEAFSLADSVQDVVLMNLVGLCYRNEGAPIHATRCFQRARTDALKLSCERGLAESLGNLGALWDEVQAAPDSVLAWLEAALSIRRRLGDEVGEAQVLRDCGAALFASQRSPDSAHSYYRRAMLIYHANRDCVREARTRADFAYHIASPLYGGRSSARAQLDTALRAQRAIRDQQGEAKTLLLISRVLSHGDQALYRLAPTDSAFHYAKQALVSYRKLDDRRGEAEVSAKLGDLYASKRLIVPDQWGNIHTSFPDECRDSALKYYLAAYDRYAGCSLLGVASTSKRMDELRTSLGTERLRAGWVKLGYSVQQADSLIDAFDVFAGREALEVLESDR